MEHHLVISILLILSVAWLLGYIFLRMGLPAMLGELLAGIILGPPLLGLVQSTPALELMADFGVFFVMFHTGLEMNPRDLIKNAWPSVAAAIGGFILPFFLGYLVTRLFGGSNMQALFVGMGISITAIAVGSMVLQSLRIQRSPVGHLIIGAALVDDVLSLIGLSVLFAVARTGSVGFGELALIFIKVVAFFGVAILIGEFVLPHVTRRLTDTEAKGFTFGLLIALAMAYLAELAGMHLIIGAFMAGQFVSREVMDHEVFEKISDRFYGIAYGFLVPIFFVSLSFHLHFDWTTEFILFAAMLTFAAIIGKVIGCGGAAKIFGLTTRESMVVGFGMNGRGAVELVVASVVLALSQELQSSGSLAEPLLTQNQFSALVLMAFVTTLLAPITLRWSVVRSCRTEDAESFCHYMDEQKKA